MRRYEGICGQGGVIIGHGGAADFGADDEKKLKEEELSAATAR